MSDEGMAIFVIVLLLLNLYAHWNVHSCRSDVNDAIDNHKSHNPMLPEDDYGVGQIEKGKLEKAIEFRKMVYSLSFPIITLLVLLSGGFENFTTLILNGLSLLVSDVNHL